MEYWQNVWIILKHLPAWGATIVGFGMFITGFALAIDEHYHQDFGLFLFLVGMILCVLGIAGLMTQYG